MVFKNQGLSEVSQKKFKWYPDIIFDFIQLQEEYGAKKSPGRPAKMSKKVKRAIIKRLSDGEITLGEIVRDPLIALAKGTLYTVAKSSIGTRIDSRNHVRLKGTSKISLIG